MGESTAKDLAKHFGTPDALMGWMQNLPPPKSTAAGARSGPIGAQPHIVLPAAPQPRGGGEPRLRRDLARGAPTNAPAGAGGQTIVLTGTLLTLSRDAAKEMLEPGAKAAGLVSKNQLRGGW